MSDFNLDKKLKKLNSKTFDVTLSIGGGKPIPCKILELEPGMKVYPCNCHENVINNLIIDNTKAKALEIFKEFTAPCPSKALEEMDSSQSESKIEWKKIGKYNNFWSSRSKHIGLSCFQSSWRIYVNDNGEFTIDKSDPKLLNGRSAICPSLVEAKNVCQRWEDEIKDKE